MAQAPERLNEPLLEAKLIELPVEGLPVEAPPHKKNRWLLILAALAGIAALALIFFLTRGDSEVSDESGRATSGGAAEAESPEIQTASGTFVISGVTEGDRYPEGCVEGPSCNVAVAGYKILVVELTPQGSADPDDVMSEGTEAYVVSSDGDRTESFMYGWNMGEGDSKVGMVAFTPQESDQDFTLYWPGNDPVELGR